MTIGFMGLGKLGLPVALGIESKGYEVLGYDVNPAVAQYLNERKIPFTEKDLQPLLDNTALRLVDVPELVEKSDILFCAVQTPHAPEFGGSTRLPEERRDFDYQYLKAAVQSVADEAKKREKLTTLVVISTCLPGTFEREIKPLLNEYIDYVYNPLFIAMGTVLDDFFNPEFILLGSQAPLKCHKVKWLYESLVDAPFVETDITTAEAVKVSYNTFITMKTVYANAWGELCHIIGANFPDLFKAWSLSTTRLLSPKYLQSGVGDGGGCHPRDNIALSYVANELGLSHNMWDDLMTAREDHMAWLARIAVNQAKEHSLPIYVLGRSFKPETNIEIGSPSLLMADIIAEEAPVIAVEDMTLEIAGVYVIGTKHSRYQTYKFPKGSIIIDPFRYINDQHGVQVIRIGDKI